MQSDYLEPNFRFGYPALTGLGDRASILFTRDGAILATYGIDALFACKVAAKNTAMRAFPTDNEFYGAVIDAVKIRNLCEDEVKVAIRAIMTRVVSVYPVESGKWYRFGTKGLNEMKDLELSFCADTVVRMGTLYFDDIEPKGLTTDMLDDLTALTASYIQKIKDVTDATSARLCGTRDRAILGNELYALIVEMFNAGKNYWFSRNEAKYKDYVIYNTPSGQAELSGEVGTITGVVFDAVSVEGIDACSITAEHVEHPILNNADGSFTMENVPIECTNIWVVRVGYESKATEVEVKKGQTIISNVFLTPVTTPPQPGT